MNRIGNPLMSDTMDLLAPQLRAGRLRVYLTNPIHSNPALNPASSACRALEAGQTFEV